MAFAHPQITAKCNCNGHGVCQTTDTLYQTYSPIIMTDSYELWDQGHTTSCVCDYGTSGSPLVVSSVPVVNTSSSPFLRLHWGLVQHKDVPQRGRPLHVLLRLSGHHRAAQRLLGGLHWILQAHLRRALGRHPRNGLDRRAVPGGLPGFAGIQDCALQPELLHDALRRLLDADRVHRVRAHPLSEQYLHS